MVSKDGDRNLSGVSLHFESGDHGTLFIRTSQSNFLLHDMNQKPNRFDIVTSRSYDQSQFLQLFFNTNASPSQLKRRERN